MSLPNRVILVNEELVHDSRCTKGYCNYLEHNLISWSSQKHRMFLALALNLNTGPLLITRLNYSGFSPKKGKYELCPTPFLFYGVITLVLLISLPIRYFMLRPSTLKSNIILFMTWSLLDLSLCGLSLPLISKDQVANFITELLPTA